MSNDENNPFNYMMKRADKNPAWGDYEGHSTIGTLSEIKELHAITVIPPYQRNGGVFNSSGWERDDAYSFLASNTPWTTQKQEHNTILVHLPSAIEALKRSTKSDADSSIELYEEYIESGRFLMSIDGQNGSDTNSKLATSEIPFPSEEHYKKPAQCQRPDLMDKFITDLDKPEQVQLLNQHMGGARYTFLIGPITYQESADVAFELNQNTEWNDQEKLECNHATSNITNYIMGTGEDIKLFAEHFTELDDEAFGQKTVNQTMAKVFLRIMHNYSQSHNPKNLIDFYQNNNGTLDSAYKKRLDNIVTWCNKLDTAWDAHYGDCDKPYGYNKDDKLHWPNSTKKRLNKNFLLLWCRFIDSIETDKSLLSTVTSKSNPRRVGIKNIFELYNEFLLYVDQQQKICKNVVEGDEDISFTKVMARNQTKSSQVKIGVMLKLWLEQNVNRLVEDDILKEVRQSSDSFSFQQKLEIYWNDFNKGVVYRITDLYAPGLREAHHIETWKNGGETEPENGTNIPPDTNKHLGRHPNKLCRACKQQKLLTAFPEDDTADDGRGETCVGCDWPDGLD